MSYYPETDSYGRNKIKVELGLPNHVTKSEVKKAIMLIYQISLKKVDLPSIILLSRGCKKRSSYHFFSCNLGKT